MKENKKVTQEEQLKNQIYDLQQQNKEIVIQLQNLFNTVLNNTNISNENFEAITKRLNCGIQ